MIGEREEIVRRARSLVGAPFRPQGRDPALGLDCVGVILTTFALGQERVRGNYRLRGAHFHEIDRELRRHFRRIAPARARAGDVLLCPVSADQLHLAISCGASFVHADARIRAVVETPGAPPWPVLGAYSKEGGRRAAR